MQTGISKLQGIEASTEKEHIVHGGCKTCAPTHCQQHFCYHQGPTIVPLLGLGTIAVAHTFGQEGNHSLVVNRKFDEHLWVWNCVVLFVKCDKSSHQLLLMSPELWQWDFQNLVDECQHMPRISKLQRTEASTEKEHIVDGGCKTCASTHCHTAALLLSPRPSNSAIAGPWNRCCRKTHFEKNATTFACQAQA